MPWGSPSLFCFSNFSPFLSDSGSNGITTYLYYGHLPEGSSSLHRFLEQFTDTFTPELADHFVNLPPSSEVQARLDELGEKANDGALTAAERAEYATYVETMDVIALLHVKSLPGDGPTQAD